MAAERPKTNRVIDTCSNNLGSSDSPVWCFRVLTGEVLTRPASRGVGFVQDIAKEPGFEVHCGDSLVFLSDALLDGLRRSKSAALAKKSRQRG